MTESKMWLKPRGKKLVVEWDQRTNEEMMPVEARNKVLISTGATMRQPSQRGWVRAIGSDVTHYSVGDYVQFTAWAGQQGQAPHGDVVIVIDEADIVAGIDEAAFVAALVAQVSKSHTVALEAATKESSAGDSLAQLRAKVVADLNAGGA